MIYIYYDIAKKIYDGILNKIKLNSNIDILLNNYNKNKENYINKIFNLIKLDEFLFFKNIFNNQLFDKNIDFNLYLSKFNKFDELYNKIKDILEDNNILLVNEFLKYINYLFLFINDININPNYKWFINNISKYWMFTYNSLM